MKSIDFTTPGMITSLRIGCYQIESPVNNIWKATFEANTNNASTDLNDEFHKNKLAFHFFKARYSHMWGYQMFLSDARQTGIFFMDSGYIPLNLRDIWACFGGRYLTKVIF